MGNPFQDLGKVLLALAAIVLLIGIGIGLLFGCTATRTVAEDTAKNGIQHSHTVRRAEPTPSRIK